MKTSKQEADLHNLAYEMDKLRDSMAAVPSRTQQNTSFHQSNSVDSQMEPKQDY
jgi:hypothetical protein